ncbi:MAG: tetratricopeptide repeat protein [Acidobacteriota bacterium]|nr:tetratricopeptide repeat protein [Acidobacteriota bacterium]
MRYRTIIAVFFALILTIGLTAVWSAETDGREGDDTANLVAADGSPTGTEEDAAPNTEAAPKKKGNRFGRFFKAPFKAVSKLFGGGDDKFQRLSEKDVAKFESSPLLRVEDANSEAAAKKHEGGSAKDYLKRGKDYLNDGKLNDAITELSHAVSLDPRLVKAHNLMAVAYDRKGLHERARESYARALDITREDAQTLNNLGYSLYLNGNYRAASERLKRAAKLAPADERIWNNLALAQSRLGKYDDAFKSFKRAGGEYTARLNVAAMLERAGREQDAIEHYEAALKLQPNSETALRRLADLYGRTGHTNCGMQNAECGLENKLSFNPQSAIRNPQSKNPQ